MELLWRLCQDRYTAAPLRRDELLQVQGPVECLGRQAFGNYEQVLIAGLGPFAACARTKQHYCHKLGGEAVLKRPDDVSREFFRVSAGFHHPGLPAIAHLQCGTCPSAPRSCGTALGRIFGEELPSGLVLETRQARGQCCSLSPMSGANNPAAWRRKLEGGSAWRNLFPGDHRQRYQDSVDRCKATNYSMISEKKELRPQGPEEYLAGGQRERLASGCRPTPRMVGSGWAQPAILLTRF